MIEWKGLFANTPYSPANNKTQDDAVIGMQDTIYVTGPGYGYYKAIARVHNASGAIVAEIPFSSCGGPLSAPAPVRILDDGTTYSYSLQVVEGAIPADDATKVVICIVGGAAKRFPGAGVNPSPDGSTLVSTDPIVSPVLSYSQKWAEAHAGASAPATYWTPYDPLFIPANSFGPNSPAKRLCINGYFNLRGNTSSAGTWDSVSIGLYLDQAKTWSNFAQKIAGTSINLPIPAGLTTRYGAFTAELSYLIHEGQTNFTQSLMYSNRIGSMNNWDPNLEVLDSFLENGNPIDWTVDHYLYTSWRVQNGTQTLVIGSRYIEARL